MLDGEDDLIGQQVGSYEISQQIGSGGMGTVYLAVQPTIGARVAIKVISSSIIDRNTTSRFFAEAKAVNLIRHERIVNILDLRLLPDGRPCIIMEFLDGASVEAVLQAGGPMPLGSLCKLIGEAADALGAAHEQGIIHRDLKPANIFVTRSGHAKILDFGVAKFIEGGPAHVTGAGLVLGTVPYMSPEQSHGAELDGRSDLFALGVVLYEAAVGVRPYPGESLPELLGEHRQLPPVPQGIQERIPDSLQDLILSMLALEPGERPQSTAEVREALDRICDGLDSEEFAPLAVDKALAEIVEPAILSLKSALPPVQDTAPERPQARRSRPPVEDATPAPAVTKPERPSQPVATLRMTKPPLDEEKDPPKAESPSGARNMRAVSEDEFAAEEGEWPPDSGEVSASTAWREPTEPVVPLSRLADDELMKIPTHRRQILMWSGFVLAAVIVVTVVALSLG